MGEVTLIGIDLAKNVFQLHGAALDGSAIREDPVIQLVESHKTN